MRTVHGSTIDGLVLAGLQPTFVAPEVDVELGIAHCVRPSALDAALARAPEAAAAIVELAGAERPPLRVQLGRDSFGAVADKLKSVAEEQERWRALAVSTDHDDVVAG